MQPVYNPFCQGVHFPRNRYVSYPVLKSHSSYQILLLPVGFVHKNLYPFLRPVLLVPDKEMLFYSFTLPPDFLCLSKNNLLHLLTDSFDNFFTTSAVFYKTRNLTCHHTSMNDIAINNRFPETT